MKEKNKLSFIGLMLILLLCPAFMWATAHHVAVNINQPPPFVASAGNDITLCSGSGDTLHASGGTSYSWSPSNGLSCANCQNPYAKPAATTTYIVTVTGEHGCSASDTIVVTVAPTLVANAGPDTTVCFGKSITLHASGGTIYNWSPSAGLSNANDANPIASPQATTTYTVTVSSGECTPVKDSMRVTVLPNPPVPTIYQNGANGATLHSSSPTSNQWYRNGILIPGATSQDYIVTQNGDYTVVVTGSNGCSSTSDSKKITVGVQSETISKMASDFVLFPNPNNGTFTVVFDADQVADYDIELRDVLGQLIHQEHLAKFSGHYSQLLDASSYPKGFYSLSLRNGKEIMVVKVLKY